MMTAVWAFSCAAYDLGWVERVAAFGAAWLRDASWFAVTIGLLKRGCRRPSSVAPPGDCRRPPDRRRFRLRPHRCERRHGPRRAPEFARGAVRRFDDGPDPDREPLSQLGRSRLWSVKLMVIGLTALYIYKIVLCIPEFLGGRSIETFVAAQPLVYLVTLPLFVVTAIRSELLRLKVHSSRKVVFHSATLIFAGILLQGTAAAALYVRHFGGTPAVVLSIVLGFAGLVAMIVALSTHSVRSQIKTFINENFFSYKYDYRLEWTKFNQALSRYEDRGGPERVLLTLADCSTARAASCSCGAPAGGNSCGWPIRPSARTSGRSRRTTAAARLRRRARGVPRAHVERRRTGDAPSGAEVPEAWLAVPLRFHDELIGFSLLQKPRARKRLDWEDRNLVALIATQLAGYLVHEQTAQALADSQQLAEFNNRVTFALHDLKNTAGQLSLLRAERRALRRRQGVPRRHDGDDPPCRRKPPGPDRQASRRQAGPGKQSAHARQRLRSRRPLRPEEIALGRRAGARRRRALRRDRPAGRRSKARSNTSSRTPWRPAPSRAACASASIAWTGACACACEDEGPGMSRRIHRPRAVPAASHDEEEGPRHRRLSGTRDDAGSGRGHRSGKQARRRNDGVAVPARMPGSGRPGRIMSRAIETHLREEPGKRILLVEDDTGLQRQMQWALDPFTMVAAGSRSEAMRHLRGNRRRAHRDPRPGSAARSRRRLGRPQGARRDPVDRAADEGDHPLRQRRPRRGGERSGARRLRFHLQADRRRRPQADRRSARRACTTSKRKTARCAPMPTGAMPGFVFGSSQMQQVAQTLERVARTDASVLILGESGTGKELIARALHEASARAAAKLVAINCASIPENLLESELFGHERGAFTGAIKQTLGKFEIADKGTLVPRRNRRHARWRCKPSCCASCRAGSSSGSAGAPR